MQAETSRTTEAVCMQRKRRWACVSFVIVTNLFSCTPTITKLTTLSTLSLVTHTNTYSRTQTPTLSLSLVSETHTNTYSLSLACQCLSLFLSLSCSIAFSLYLSLSLYLPYALSLYFDMRVSILSVCAYIVSHARECVLSRCVNVECLCAFVSLL
jgi:hypothetical protein